MRIRKRWLAIWLVVPLAVMFAARERLFSIETSVGVMPKGGKVKYDSHKAVYRITGGGANIWAKEDAFQFVYQETSGDVVITADVKFDGKGKEEHRKAALMIRQSLDPNAAYADVALHGNGLTSLQYRETLGDITKEVPSDLKAPGRIRIERRGDQFTIFAGKPGEELTKTGPVTVKLQDPVYIGLAVSAHNVKNLETAEFSDVEVERGPKKASVVTRSHLMVYDLASKKSHEVYKADGLFEAPNWSPDGKSLLINKAGELYTLAAEGKSEPVKVNLNGMARCNNDKSFSPDGKTIAFSSSANAKGSQVYTVRTDGGEPAMIVPETPSYFHGFSPDGHWMAVVAQRNGNFDLFRVAAQGGPQERLTSNAAYDDGPDYSPDGKWIYFNSDRVNGWDIWRMPADGAGTDDKLAERVTSDDEEDWFPHPSPDGKWLLFLSFPRGTAGHNDRLKVTLRMMPMPGESTGKPKISTLLKLFGGQGTINVNSWSPDSTKFAYVTYEE